MEAVGKILDTWMQQRKVDFIANYHAKGLKASGNLERKARVESTETKSEFWVPQYTGALLYGRSKNSNQSPEAKLKFMRWAGYYIFTKWVKDKGLNLNPYALAWHIADKGITVPNTHNDGNLYKDTFTQARFNELYSSLSKPYLLYIKEQVRATWQR